MRTATFRVFLLLFALLSTACAVHAQQISGFSTLTFETIPVPAPTPGGLSADLGGPINCPPPRCSRPTERVTEAYADTEEDYTAALYYNVQSTSAIYSGGSSAPSATQTFSGNPTASGSYVAYKTGLMTEVTAHLIDFFYVTSIGEYYDPYGFSVVNNNPDGDYDSGYWFSVDVYATYITEASVILGEDYDTSSDSEEQNFQGPTTETVIYQNFIPPDYVYGPPLSTCPNSIYAGDNRVTSTGAPAFNPAIGSYRALQAISVGVGGLTNVNPSNAPPAQATGFTYRFSNAVLVNNQIPPTAYNYNYLNQCSSKGIDAWGHAPTDGMVLPNVTYNGTNQTSTTFQGSASDPIPLIAFAIDWNISVVLSEPSASDLHVGGNMLADCYPAHEVSVGGYDVATWPPSSNDIVYISGCLGGISQVNQAIGYDIPLTPVTPIGGGLN